jgi:hypothetical protein
VDAGLADQAAGHVDGGVQFCGELGQTCILLAPRHQVGVEVGEAEGAGVAMEAASLSVNTRGA